MKSIRAVAAVVATVPLVIGVTTAGQAAAAERSAPFAAQAHQAGLNDAQARSLQQRVDAYLADGDGVQVAVNQIDVKGASRLVLALPGEQYARAPEAPLSGPAPLAAPPCYSGDFCGYARIKFGGDYRYYYACQTVTFPWNAYGSYIDNQTRGTKSLFHYPSGTTTVYAPTSNQKFDWGAIDSIKIC